MSETDVPMKEFLLWSNCPNNCQFCWQRKLAKPEMDLSEEEKLQAISSVRDEIKALPYSDILIVGGEVYCPHSPEVNTALQDLFRMIRARIDAGLTRLMYANTNMIYSDRVVLKGLLDEFIGAEDKLRLTTSYDVYGRYATPEAEQLFLSNLAWVHETYPNIHPVVNCILTKQMCSALVNETFLPGKMYNKYGLAFLNFIPYIAIEKGDEMFPTWNEITAALMHVEAVQPHYLRYYVDQLDFRQDRVLKEYHKDIGFEECTSEYLDCGHNGNYRQATEDGECYVCKLKDTIAVDLIAEGVDEAIAAQVQAGGKIWTVGDTCSQYVWTHYIQPDVVVFDGRTHDDDVDVLALVRQSNTPRRIVINEGEFLSDDLDTAIYDVARVKDKYAVQVIGEEDSAIFPCLRHAPKDALVIAGDPHRKSMVYYRVK